MAIVPTKLTEFYNRNRDEIFSVASSIVSEVNFYIVSPAISIGKLSAGVPFALPYNPQKITVTQSGRNRTSNIVGLGEILLMDTPHLEEISFSSFFPEKQYMLHLNKVGTWLPPKAWVEAIQMAQEQRQPLRLVITGLGFNEKVAIKSFNFEHKDGAYEDVYYSISFTKYRDYKVSRLTSESPDLPQETKKDLEISQQKKNVNNDAGNKLGSKAPNTVDIENTQITNGSRVIANGDAFELDDLSSADEKLANAPFESPYSRDGGTSLELYQEADGSVPVQHYEGVVFAKDTASGDMLIKSNDRWALVNEKDCMVD